MKGRIVSIVLAAALMLNTAAVPVSATKAGEAVFPDSPVAETESCGECGEPSSHLESCSLFASKAAQEGGEEKTVSGEKAAAPEEGENQEEAPGSGENEEAASGSGENEETAPGSGAEEEVAPEAGEQEAESGSGGEQEEAPEAEENPSAAKEQEADEASGEDQGESDSALGQPIQVTAWSWIDEWEILDPDTGVVALPGANERNRAQLEDIIALLPVEISAAVRRETPDTENLTEGTQESSEETIPLGDWSCADFPTEGAGSGSFVFTAALPEGYELAEDAPELAVTVELGGAALFAGGTYDFSTSQSVLTINSSNKDQYDGTIITGSYTLDIGGDILVIDGATVNLTIEDLTLSTTGATTSGYSPIDLRNGAVLNLTVKGTNTLTAEYHAAGIHVPEGCTLNITSASTGTLTVTGGGGYGGGAGIGADGNGYFDNRVDVIIEGTTQTCGTINIAGGTIIATGGTHVVYGGEYGGGAGIGGSSTGDTGGVASTGRITISGGNVTATGGGSAAGIGGGECGYVESITITGGTVKATAKSGVAIGTGQDGRTGADIACGDKMKISITGGTVTGDGNIGYGEVLEGNSMTGGSVTIGTNASVVLTDGHKIDHGDASNYAIIPVTLNVYDGRLTGSTVNVTVAARQGGSRIGGAAVELAVSDYHGTGKFNFVVPAGNATGATDFTVTGGGFTTTGSATLSTGSAGTTVTCGQQLYPVTLTFLDDTKFTAAKEEYGVNEGGFTVTFGDSTPADSTIMAVPTKTIKYHSASMGTMVVWLAAGTYKISVTQNNLKADGAMTGSITVTGSAILNMLNNTNKQTPDSLDLSYGPIKFYTENSAYKVNYYTSENPYDSTKDTNTPTTAEVLVSAPFVVTQSGETTTNTITIENWGTSVPLDLTIDGLNIQTSTALDKAANAGHIDINGSAVNLNLSGSSSLKSTYTTSSEVTAALVSVDGTSSLIIDGSGSLTVTTSAYAAAIGGDRASKVGTITIKGGTVNAANTQTSMTAIGTGDGGSSLTSGGHAVITITGGTVTATVGYNTNNLGQGTAIGACFAQRSNVNTASVTIKGGEVNATGISGGTVTAANTGEGPAIGGSGYSEYYSSAVSDTGSSVTISGGIVTATNNNTKTAAIGASQGRYINRTNVTITGGRVTATNNAGGGVAIGGGNYTQNDGTTYYTYTNVTITGGTVAANGVIGSAA